jgi:replicative DNA helicase
MLRPDSDIAMLPPHDLDAEKCVLASIAIDKTCVAEVVSLVRREDFYSPDNQVIFGVLMDMVEAGTAIDAVLLPGELRKRQLLDDVGGIPYLASLFNTVPSSCHAAFYARTVAELSRLRRLIALSEAIQGRCYAATDSRQQAADVLQMAIDGLAEIQSSVTGADIRPIGDVLHEVWQQLAEGGVESVPYGFRDLDAVTGGIQRGELAIIAARPSMGKSTIAKQIALQNAMVGTPVGFISAEEGRFKIGRNLLSALTGVNGKSLRQPQFLGEADWRELEAGYAKAKSLPLFVRDRISALADVTAIASMMVAKHGCKLIVIDHMHRIRGDGRDQYEKVTNISGRLSDLFKRLDVAGLVLAQLRRFDRTQRSKIPTMEDLRDSGAIEQDADQILMLHREDYYHITDANWTPTREAMVIVAKNREGARDKPVLLRTDMKTQRFEDKAPEPGSDEELMARIAAAVGEEGEAA